MPHNQKITVERIIDALDRDDNSGFCFYCGEEAYGVEPDAQRYKCESCGQHSVYGAEECLLMIAE